MELSIWDVMLVFTSFRVWSISDLKILYQRYLTYMAHAILAFGGKFPFYRINLVKLRVKTTL